MGENAWTSSRKVYIPKRPLILVLWLLFHCPTLTPALYAN